MTVKLLILRFQVVRLQIFFEIGVTQNKKIPLSKITNCKITTTTNIDASISVTKTKAFKVLACEYDAEL